MITFKCYKIFTLFILKKLIKKREGYKVVITPIAIERMKNNQCPACGLPKEKWTRSKTWRCCSSACTDKYWKEFVIANGWQQLREVALERDGWKCVKCGKQPLEKRPLHYEHSRQAIAEMEFFKGFFKENNYEWYWWIDKNQLVADHIFAIALGGDEWSLENIQTLCLECNKIKTAEDAKKIALLRRKEKQINKGQTFLHEICQPGIALNVEEK
jgi:hypothetical protein